MQGLLIDAYQHRIYEVTYDSVTEMQTLIGGYLELAYTWPNGDTLYVDEEGLLKRPIHFFTIPERPDQPLAGNGLLVGKENVNFTVDPPTMTIETLRTKVRWPTVI